MENYRKENYVKDKVIIITGASSGFGRCAAIKAAAMGGKVVLAARREERLAKAVEEIQATGGEAAYIKTDVRCYDQVKAMVQFAIDTYGRVDVLVNDAGVMPQSFFSDHCIEAWDECIDTCIKGVLYGMDAVYDPMMAQGRGQIINISSIMGNFPTPGCGVYSAAKASVKILSDTLRMEARGKIKVTTIKPTGCTKTELFNTVVSMTASAATLNGKRLEGFTKPKEGAEDKSCINFSNMDPEDLADNIIYAIDQPWGVNVSDITVRTSGERLFV